MPELVRRISWLKAARKEFDDFPQGVQIDMATALTEAARARKADTAKPFKGVSGGIFEIAIRHRGDAFRAIYAVQIGERTAERVKRELSLAWQSDSSAIAEKEIGVVGKRLANGAALPITIGALS